VVVVVVVALHAVPIGHGHPAAISLLLDAVAYGADLGLRLAARSPPLPAAIVISAAIFSLAHLGWMEWSLLLPVFGIGCVLAALYHYSRSLWPGIFVHASINTVATLVVVMGGTHC
jgi:membrane protease YdiL (CAAX protease family)